MTTIIIGGDVYPVGSIQKAFVEGNADMIFHDLLEEIAKADLSIVNLESPLVLKKTPIKKPGDNLCANISAIKGFVAAKWQVLNLANNHSFDQGAQGLLETMHTIRQAGLVYVGAGADINEALAPYIKEINGERIVIYAIAEHEFSCADEKTPGANPLDLINFVNSVRQHKQNGIFIVLIHGGKEFYPYPSPEMVRRCRFMVDIGADAVICCHTHCPQPWEIYNGSPIIYGLGNLVFEPLKKANDSWYEGYLAKLTIDGGQVHFLPIPYIQSKSVAGAIRMDGTERNLFLDRLQIKSTELKNSKFLEAQWLKYCRSQKVNYLEILFGYNRVMLKMSSLLFKMLHSKKAILRALHLVQCETHQEILSTIFRDEKREG